MTGGSVQQYSGLRLATSMFLFVSSSVHCYLHCSCTGEADCAHACRLWPNRGVEYGWFVWMPRQRTLTTKLMTNLEGTAEFLKLLSFFFKLEN